MWVSLLCCKESRPLCSYCEWSPELPRTSCPLPVHRRWLARLHLGPKYLWGGGAIGNIERQLVNPDEDLTNAKQKILPWNFWSRIIWDNFLSTSPCKAHSLIVNTVNQKSQEIYETERSGDGKWNSSTGQQKLRYLREFDEGGDVCNLLTKKNPTKFQHT